MLEIEYVSREDLEKQLKDFRILFAYNSNRIENEETDYDDVRELFENGKVVGFSGDPRTLFEIQNQKNCYSFLIDKVISKEKISVSFIKQLHSILTNGTYDETRYAKAERPGEFKKGDYIVGIHEIGSDPDDVEKDIGELVDEIKENRSDDHLLVASYMHCRFEAIHPFADGNGRVGRALLNYYFLINHIRPLIIYNEDKKRYYECLRIYDAKQDIKPMMEFLEYCQKKTWERKKKEYRNLASFI